jgi:UDP-glucose 4-epimerase
VNAFLPKSQPMKNVLITGGAGFIGSHLARAWVKAGANVTVLDNLRSGKRKNLAGIPHRFVDASVEDAGAVRNALKDADIVHHMAALVSVPESMEKPEETERINVLGALNVLNAAKHYGVQKVVFSSTSAVYGLADRPAHSELHLPEPASPYAISKLAGEQYMNLFSQAHGVPTVALRYFNVFGPGQDPNSPYAAAVAIFSERAAANQPIKIFGDGEQTRDFIYVSDVVRANMFAAENGNGVYNVSRGDRLTINNLAKTIIQLSGSSSTIEYAAERPGDVKHSRGNADRLRALGWGPMVSLEEGLQETLSSFQLTEEKKTP